MTKLITPVDLVDQLILRTKNEEIQVTKKQLEYLRDLILADPAEAKRRRLLTLKKYIPSLKGDVTRAKKALEQVESELKTAQDEMEELSK